MAWSAPMTAVTGSVFSASQWNQYVRDDLGVSEVAVAVTAGSLIVTTGANTVTERTPDVGYIYAVETTTSTSYTDLGGNARPSVTVTSGTKAVILIGAQMANTNAGLGSRTAFAVSGASSIAASDTDSFYTESGNANDGMQGSWATMLTSLTGGSNTFTLKYRTTAGGGTSSFGHRHIAVIPF